MGNEVELQSLLVPLDLVSEKGKRTQSVFKEVCVHSSPLFKHAAHKSDVVKLLYGNTKNF